MLLPGVALAAVVTFVAPAAAWNEPDGFRDLRWGASESAVRAQPTWRYCEDVDKPLARALELRDLARRDAMKRLGDRRCVHELKIGEIPVVADFYFKGAFGDERTGLRRTGDRALPGDVNDQTKIASPSTTCLAGALRAGALVFATVLWPAF